MELSLDNVKDVGNKIAIAFKHWRFGTKQQLAFLEDLYVLINDGIPANRAIDMMAQITIGLQKEVAQSLSKKIGQGQPLADGMKEWFSTNVIEIVRVGEAGGALAQTLKSAINMLSQQGASIGAFIGAVTYPLAVIVMGCCMIVYLNSSVFKQFALIKPMSEWPSAGTQLVALGDFIQHWWWLSILIVIALIIIVSRLMSNYVGDYRRTLDQFPPFNLYRRFAAARLLETLGLLVANGVVFKSAIRVMQYQANPYLNSHLIMMEHLLSMGKTNIADVLATGLISQNDLMRLRVMAEVKGFEQGLIRMGVLGSEQATATLRYVSRIIGGIFLGIGGILILMIIRGIFMTGMAMGA